MNVKKFIADNPLFLIIILPSVVIIINIFLISITSTLFHVFGTGNFNYSIFILFVPLQTAEICSSYFLIRKKLKYSSNLETYFKNNDAQKAVENDVYIRKILNIGTFFLIILTIILGIILYLNPAVINKFNRELEAKHIIFHEYISYEYVLMLIPFPLVVPMYVIILYFWRVYYNNEYRFYLSKSYINLAVNKNEIKKLNYVIFGLKSYNRYLQRNLKLQINNIERIYSRILSQKYKESSVESIGQALNSDDKLKLIEYLSYIWTFNDENKEQFLIKVSLTQTLQTWAAVIVPLLALIIPIVQLLLKYLWNVGK